MIIINFLKLYKACKLAVSAGISIVLPTPCALFMKLLQSTPPHTFAGFKETMLNETYNYFIPKRLTNGPGIERRSLLFSTSSIWTKI